MRPLEARNHFQISQISINSLAWFHANEPENMFSYTIKAGLGMTAYLGIVALDEKTFVSLGILSLVLSAVWWLGRKIQSLEDGLNEIRRHFLNGDQHSRKSHGGED
jgi:hypothetical protein